MSKYSQHVLTVDFTFLQHEHLNKTKYYITFSDKCLSISFHDIVFLNTFSLPIKKPHQKEINLHKILVNESLPYALIQETHTIISHHVVSLTEIGDYALT